MVTNGNMTDWKQIPSVIIRVIKSDLFNHEYDYRPNWTAISEKEMHHFLVKEHLNTKCPKLDEISLVETLST